MASRARAKIDDVIGATNRVFVVFDDQHRVAEVAQRLQRVQQAIVVAMVQADGGLIEHVEHATQLRADLRRQANALAFAAAQRGRRALQRDVAQPHGIQEAEAFGDLFQDAAGDLLFPRVELDLRRGFERARHRHRGEVGDGHAVHLDRKAFRAQPFAVARWTSRRRHVFQQPFAVTIRRALLHRLPQIREDAEKAAALFLARVGAVEDEVLRFARKLLERRR